MIVLKSEMASESREVFEQADKVRALSISYYDLNASVDTRNVRNILERGLGKEGLGIVSVTDIPTFPELRKRLLPMAAKLASMPEDVQKTWEDPESKYNVGWSSGKEWLGGDRGSERVRDTNKGSWYANPLHDVTTDDPKLLKEYPSYTRPNIWPTNSVPELERAFKELGRLMYDVGMKLLHACCEDDDTPLAASESTCAKGRLLCYMPRDEKSDEMMWCGWHRDHGSLTALCPAYYMASIHGHADPVEIDCPDACAGLYVKTRQGKVVKVLLDRDALAFQVGEALETLSEGRLQATPHCVLASREYGITRCTCALFMQPHWDQMLGSKSHCKSSVEHWHAGITFGDFSKAKFQAYYNEHTEENS